MLTEIRNLREIARRCLAGEALDEDLSNWFGTSLQEFLERRASTLNDAFGLRGPQGGVPWWMEDAIRLRDAALRELAERFHHTRSVSAQAQEIRRRALRYAASAWRFDCERAVMPPRYRGTQKECLWRAFKAGAAMPLSERQLRNILACSARTLASDDGAKLGVDVYRFPHPVSSSAQTSAAGRPLAQPVFE